MKKPGLLARTLRKFGYEPVRKRNAFAGAVSNRLTSDWFTTQLGPSMELAGSIRMLRQRARDLERNNPLARRYLNILAENVVGHRGIRLQAKNTLPDGSLNDQANDVLEDGFCEWGRVCTVDGRLSWVALQQLVIRTIARDGECFLRLVKPWSGHGMAVQVIDADLVDDQYNVGPQEGRGIIRLGVEVDQWAKPIAYHVLKNHPGEFLGGSVERQRIPASEILHLFIARRPGQVRGESWFAPVMMSLRMLDGYAEAELVAARTSAAKMGFIQKSADATTGSDPNDTTLREFEASPGSIEELDVGETFAQWDPTHPSMNFPAFVVQIEKLIAGGLNVAYASLSGDLREVNYSSIRAGLLQERDGWRSLQVYLAGTLCEPVFQLWRDVAWYNGHLKLRMTPEQYADHQWQPRGWPWVDPVKDVEAAALSCAYGFNSPQRVVGEDGEDYEEIQEERAEAQKIAAENGVTIMLPAGNNNVQGTNAAEQGTANPNDGSGSGGAGKSGSGGRAHPPLAVVRSAR